MKKKILTMALCAATVASLVGCGNKKVETPEPSTEIVESTEQTEESTEADTETVVATYDNVVDVLTTAHSQFDEEMLGYLGGGFGEEVVMGGVGTFPLEDTESLRAILTFPAESVELVDEAASIMHMMNANTYTSAAFHVADTANIEALETAILDTVKNNQWICGFPEQLVIGHVDSYVVYAYGNLDLITMFQNGVAEFATVDYIESLVAVEEPVDDVVAFDGEAAEGETVSQEELDAFHKALENGEIPTEEETWEVVDDNGEFDEVVEETTEEASTEETKAE